MFNEGLLIIIPQLHITILYINSLSNKHSLIMLLETFFRPIRDLPAFADFTGEFHFLRICSVRFDKFTAVMAKENNGSTIRIESDFFFSVR